jgi:hypothetical protein
MTAPTKVMFWASMVVASAQISGWLALNALAAAGVIAMIAFAIGSFSLPLTMLQLANLADRYVAANIARRDQFDQIVLIGFLAAFLLISVFRLGSLVRDVWSAFHVE